jgi:hypothetical protein
VVVVTPPQPVVTPPVEPVVPVTPPTQPVTPPETTTPAVVANSNQQHSAGRATKVGQLMVSANVNGANISVDGRTDPSWVTPHTIPDLSAGAHNVTISMDGYESARQSVTIEGGQTAQVVGNLSAPKAELDIITRPAGVEVLIDGKSYGPSPISAILPLGTHTYTVKQPGAAPYEKTITLKSGDLIAKTVTLGEVAATGIVEVRSIPTGASVEADGAPVGGQTPTSFRLSVGTHVLVITLAGYPPIHRQVTVSANATTTANVILTSQ